MTGITEALTVSKLLQRWPFCALVPRRIALHATPIEIEVVGWVDTGSALWLKMVLDEMGLSSGLVFVAKTVGTDGLKVAPRARPVPAPITCLERRMFACEFHRAYASAAQQRREPQR